MKLKIVIAILALIAVAVIAHSQYTTVEARMSVVTVAGGVPVVGETCSVDNDEALETIVSFADATSSQDVNSTTRYRAQSIVLGSTSTITQYIFSARSAADDGNLVVSLFTNNDGVPENEISDTSVSIGWSTISRSPEVVTATLSSPKTGLSAGTHWDVWRSDDAGAEGSIIVYYIEAGNPDGTVTFAYDIAGSWFTQTDRDAYLVIIGCD